MSATVPLAGDVKEATFFGPPSGSVSLASTSIAVAAAFSFTVAASLTAVGGVSTETRCTVAVAATEGSLPSLATKWMMRSVVLGAFEVSRYLTVRRTVTKSAIGAEPAAVMVRMPEPGTVVVS